MPQRNQRNNNKDDSNNSNNNNNNNDENDKKKSGSNKKKNNNNTSSNKQKPALSRPPVLSSRNQSDATNDSAHLKPPMTLQEIQDERQKQVEREARQMAAAAPQQQQNNNNNNHHDTEFHRQRSDFWETQFNRLSQKNVLNSSRQLEELEEDDEEKQNQQGISTSFRSSSTKPTSFTSTIPTNSIHSNSLMAVKEVVDDAHNNNGNNNNNENNEDSSFINTSTERTKKKNKKNATCTVPTTTTATTSSKVEGSTKRQSKSPTRKEQSEQPRPTSKIKHHNSSSLEDNTMIEMKKKAGGGCNPSLSNRKTPPPSTSTSSPHPSHPSPPHPLPPPPVNTALRFRNDDENHRIYPGAVAIDGPGVNGTDDDDDDDLTTARMTTDYTTDASMTPAAGVGPGNNNDANDSNDDVVHDVHDDDDNDHETGSRNGIPNAQMISDVEAIYTAEDIQLDFTQRYKHIIIITFCLCIIIVTTLLSVLLSIPLPEIIEDGDPLCWESHRYNRTVPIQCFCEEQSTQQYVDTNMTKENMKLYSHILSILQRKEIIVETNWTLAVTSTLNETDTFNDSDNEEEEEEEETSDDDENPFYSCEPINQVLLILSDYELRQFESYEEAVKAPESFWVEFYVFMYIYVTMGGIKWKEQKGWLEKGELCELHGVDCLFVYVFHRLALPNNNLIGNIPSEIQHLNSLRFLDLSSNEGINGTIPSELAQLTSVTQINFADMNLTGAIPSQLGELERLESLLLEDNQLTGSIPPELFGKEGKENNLKSLDFSRNLLTSSIPTEIALSGRLMDLRLQDNQFTGQLPMEMVDQTNRLELLNVGFNQFTGNIPTFLAKLPNLELMSFYKSGFTGPIPYYFCSGGREPPNSVGGLNKNLNTTDDSGQEENSKGESSKDTVVMIVECGTTDFCGCCKNRSSGERAAKVQVECGENLMDGYIGLDF